MNLDTLFRILTRGSPALTEMAQCLLESRQVPPVLLVMRLLEQSKLCKRRLREGIGDQGTKRRYVDAVLLLQDILCHHECKFRRVFHIVVGYRRVHRWIECVKAVLIGVRGCQQKKCACNHAHGTTEEIAGLELLLRDDVAESI